MGMGAAFAAGLKAYNQKTEVERLEEKVRLLSDSNDTISSTNFYEEPSTTSTSSYGIPSYEEYKRTGKSMDEYTGAMSGTSPKTNDTASMVLSAISNNEGTGETGYNTEYGYGKYGKDRADLSEMSLNEVLDYQQTMLDNNDTDLKSSAIGRYQMLAQTIRDEMKYGGLTGTELFTNDLQDSMMMGRLKRMRGYDDWESGKITDDDFRYNLSKEFASVINPKTGTGYYPGQGAKPLLLN